MPPCGECQLRWVGRTWPRLKKVVVNLRHLGVSTSSRDGGGVWWMSGNILILEAYVVSAETPPEVLDIHSIAKGEDAPYQRIIESVSERIASVQF